MHVIRLRKPWSVVADQKERIDGIDIPEINPAQIVEGSSLVYTRKFNATPPVLRSTVILKLLGYNGRLTEICLNQTSIPIDRESATIATSDLTDLLQAHNRINVSLVRSNGVSPRLTGEVILEISDRDTIRSR